jgi:transposase
MVHREDAIMRIAQAVVISETERRVLRRWSRGRSVPARLVLRAKIVLLAAAGKMNKEIVAELGTGMKTVCLWRNRFVKSGLQAIEKDAPRGGRPSDARAEMAAQIVRVTTTEKPPGATHWSTRSLAAHLGTSPAMVQRVWKANRLQPHRTKTFKLSNDPHFAEKLIDVVGWCLDPPGLLRAAALRRRLGPRGPCAELADRGHSKHSWSTGCRDPSARAGTFRHAGHGGACHRRDPVPARRR